MKLIKFKYWQINLLLFFILVVVVCFIQYFLLQPIFKLGLTADDWQLLFAYKTYGPAPPVTLNDILAVWKFRGPYTTSQFYYIGVLESLFGLNYQAFHTVNIIIKTISTLLVFPFILILFKRRLLAFLATVLYAISYSSTGSLQLVVFGTEHLAISLMLIFFVAYYYSFQKDKQYHLMNIFTLLVLPLLLAITFLISPIRIYPLLAVLPLIEIYLWFRTKSSKVFIRSLITLMALYLPVFLFSIISFEPASRNLNGPVNLYSQMVINGNWQLILTPFSGLGYIFATDDFFKLMNVFNVVNFMGPVLIYGLLTALISLIVSKKPIKFFLLVCLVNLFIQIAIFWSGYKPRFFYPSSLGIYLFIIGIFTFIEWLRRKKDTLLIILTGGLIYSMVFLWSIWLILGSSLDFGEAIHRYFVMPSLGASLSVTALLVLFYDKAKQFRTEGFKLVSVLLIIILVYQLYQFSSKEVSKYYNNLLSIGSGAKEQQFMQGGLVNKIRGSFNETNPEPILIYFDGSTDPQNFRFYETTLNYQCFGCLGFWFLILRNTNLNGCVGVVYDLKELKNLVTIEDDREGFNSDGLCIEHKYLAVEDMPNLWFTREVDPRASKVLVYEVGKRKVNYKPENFYAFRLKNRELLDIKHEVLQDLGVLNVFER